ncbi:MAG: hypothetical protein ACO3ZY_10390, partial [Phycisphaerales bacterium]
AFADGERLFWSEAEARSFAESHHLSIETVGESAADPTRRAMLRELHENRELERLFETLAKQQVSIDDFALVQEESVSGERLPTRYAWLVRDAKGRRKAKATSEADASTGEAEATEETDSASDTVAAASNEEEIVEVANIPGILRTLGEIGRRGIEVKRFKGLGEMDAEQLWETTMDPAKRTLMKVTWDAASEAETLFSTLMGENVERRRHYIEKHALEVRNLDV